jgi:hypothetical protein
VGASLGDRLLSFSCNDPEQPSESADGENGLPTNEEKVTRNPNGKDVRFTVGKKPSNLKCFCRSFNSLKIDEGVESSTIEEKAYNFMDEVPVKQTTNEDASAYDRDFKIQSVGGGTYRLTLKSDPLLYVGTVASVEDEFENKDFFTRVRIEPKTFCLFEQGVSRTDIIAPVKLNVVFQVPDSATKREAFSFFNEKFERAAGFDCKRFKGCE